MNPSEFSKCECRHCHGHIEFPSDAAGQTAPCPHCGQLIHLADTRKNRSRLALIATIGLTALLIGGTLFFVFEPVGQPVIQKGPNPTNAPDRLKDANLFSTNDFSVANIQLAKTTNSSLIYVTGRVRNLAAQKRFGVKISFALFDAHAAPVGDASDYLATLEPKADWHFKALVLDSKAVTCQLNTLAETP